MATDYRYAARLLIPSEDKTERRYQIIKELTESEYDRFSDSYSYIDEIVNLNIFTYMESTLKDFKDAVRKDMEELESGKFDFEGQDDIVRIGTRMRSAVLAFCSALHFHQEHTYTEILLTNDGTSRIYKQVRQIFNRLYDKSPEYRLLYHVRNTMVHCTLQTIKIRAGFIPNAEGADHCYTNPEIDISAIANMNTQITPAYKRELEEYNEDPSVIKTIATAYPLIREANGRILGRMYPDIALHCASIREFCAPFGDKQGVWALTKADALTGPRNETSRGWARNVIEYAKNH